MMAAAAPMGAPGVFAAMQMRKDTDGKMRAATAEGTPVPMSQEEYNTQVSVAVGVVVVMVVNPCW